MRSAALILYMVLTCYCTAACGQTTSKAKATRPFYVIGHMANSIETLDSFLAQGANAAEIDVTFESNGAAWWVFHGVPCDYFRVCHESTQFVDYLRAASSRNLSLLLLDLKCSKLTEEAMQFAGVDLARKLKGHFWEKGGRNINVVVSIQQATHRPLLKSFLEEVRSTDEVMMDKLSFDVSENPDLNEVSKMYRDLNITSAWQGDGVTNWIEPFRSFSRLRYVLHLRDRGDHVVKKVYRWTVDWKSQIRQLIHLGVDGVITNNPERCLSVLAEINAARLALQKDPINNLFEP